MAIKKATPIPSGAPTATVRVTVYPSEGTATFYANHAEITATQHDFTLLFTQVPAKPGAEDFESARLTGELRVPASVQLTIPTSLMAGLVRALTMQKELYEKQYGVKLSEPALARSGGQGEH